VSLEQDSVKFLYGTSSHSCGESKQSIEIVRNLVFWFWTRCTFFEFVNH